MPLWFAFSSTAIQAESVEASEIKTSDTKASETKTVEVSANGTEASEEIASNTEASEIVASEAKTIEVIESEVTTNTETTSTNAKESVEREVDSSDSTEPVKVDALIKVRGLPVLDNLLPYRFHQRSVLC